MSMGVPVMNQNDMEQLEQLLRQLLQPDNVIITQATQRLKEYFKQPESILAFTQMSCTSQYPEIRQLAAVVLRRRLPSRWEKISAEQQEVVKSELLNNILNEPQRIVRQAVGRVVGAIGREDLRQGKWDGLMKFLYECCQSGEVLHRESGMFIISILVETELDVLKPHLQHLFQLFDVCLKDTSSPHVPLYTINAITELLSDMNEAEMGMFRTILPGVIGAIRFLLGTSEQEAMKALDIFEVVLDTDVGLASVDIKGLMEFSLEIGCNKGLEDDTRVKGLTFILLVCMNRRRVVVKNKMTPVILNAIFPILTEGIDEEDDDDMEEVTPSKFAAQIIDTMAIHLPPESIFPPAMQIIDSWRSSAEPGQRSAAMIALLVLVEGCTEMMRENLEPVLKFTYSGLEDPVQKVRENACIALSELSAYLQPEILDFKEDVLPRIFNALNDPSPSVQEKSCCAVEAFCENLGEDITPYIQPLVEKLLFMLQQGKPVVKETALGALAATASSAGEDFLPFFPQVLAVVKHFLSIQDIESMNLRAYASDCVGNIAKAVGRKHFEPYVEEFMMSAINGLQNIDSPEVRSCTYSLFSSIAEMLEEDFAPYLPHIMPFLQASLQSESGIVANDDNGDMPVNFDDSEDEDEEGNMGGMSVHTSFLEEKETALNVIGALAINTGDAFMPYVENTLQIVVVLGDYFYPDICKAAAQTMGNYCVCVYKARMGDKEWEGGLPAKQPLDEGVQSMSVLALQNLLRMLKESDDKNLAIGVCEAINQVISTCGPAAAEPFLDELNERVYELLTNKACCQDEEEEDDEMSAELDIMLIEAVAEIVSTLAKILKEGFCPLFERYAPIFLKYNKKTNKVNERSMAVGLMAEICNKMGPSVSRYVAHLLPIFLEALGAKEEDVRCNAAYGIGCLAENGGQEVQQHYPTILQALSHNFGGKIKKRMITVVDNCVSAVCRMIRANKGSVPMDQVFPVVMANLPLKSDFTENAPVMMCLCQLLAEQDQTAFSHIQAILTVFVHVLKNSDRELTDDSKTLVRSTIAQIRTQFPDEMNKLIPSFSQEDASYLTN
eukprot:Nk52_evm40s2449 gene=Nk52_evmTU40s2449